MDAPDGHPARRASASRNSALRPPRPLPRTVTVVSPPDSSTQGAGSGWPWCAHWTRDAGHGPAPPRAPRPRCASPRISGVTPAARATAAAASSDCLRRGDHARLAVGEAGGRRASAFRPRRFEQVGARGAGSVDAVALEDRQRVGAGRRIGARWGRRRSPPDRRPAHRRSASVTHARRRSGGGQTPALDRRQVLAHAVHLVDAGAARQQGAVHRLLVGQRDAVRRQRPAAPSRRRRSGTSTRSSGVRPCTACQDARAPPCAGGVGHRDARPRRPRCAGRARRGRSASPPGRTDRPASAPRTPRAMAAAALPAPITRVRPLGGRGRKRAMHAFWLRGRDRRVEHRAQQPARVAVHRAIWNFWPVR